MWCVWRETHGEGRKPNEIHIHSAVPGAVVGNEQDALKQRQLLIFEDCCRKETPQTAKSVLSKMREDGMLLQPQMFEALMQAFFERQEYHGVVETAADMLGEQMSMSPESVEILRESLILDDRDGQYHEAEWNMGRTLALPEKDQPIVECYRKMRADASRGEVSLVLDGSKELRRLGTAPRMLERELLCEAYAVAGDLEAAEAELQSARESQSDEEPGEAFYASILRAKKCGKYLDESAGRMEERGVVAGRRYFAARVHVLLRLRKLKEVRTDLRGADPRHIPDLCELYKQLITALGMERDSDEIAAVVKNDYVQRNLYQSRSWMRTVMRAHAQAGNLRRALVVFAKLRRAYFDTQWDEQSEEDIATLISAYGHAGYFKKAEAKFTRWRTQSVSTTGAAFRAMLEVYAKFGYCQYFEAMLYEMRIRAVPIAEPEMLLLIVAYMNAGNTARAVATLEKIESSGVKVPPVVVQKLLTALARSGEGERCERIFFRYRDQVDESCWNLVILAWAKARSTTHVLRIMDRMAHEGVEPDDVARQCMAFIDKKGFGAAN